MEILFSKRSRQVMDFAQEEGLRISDSSLKPRHLLVAIVKEGSGIASQMLCEAGANLDAIRQVLGPPALQLVRGSALGRNESFRQAIDLARRMATHQGGQEVCPVHLMAGIIQVEDEDVLKALKHFQLEPNHFASELLGAYQKKKDAKRALALLQILLEKSNVQIPRENFRSISLDSYPPEVLEIFNAWFHVPVGETIETLTAHVPAKT